LIEDKAPGPDGVPNVVLKRCMDVLIDRIYYLFRAIFELETYPDEWKESTTVVLRKPGKPSYEAPKAYRPIALLNTLGKLFSTLVADDLSHFCETRHALPRTQFGGRPSHCTSDSMLLLTQSIKDAWRSKKVASVLFLDVQGAFPNVVKEVLLHNMRSRGVPTEYIKVIKQMLTGRKTRLSFDDFISDFIMINNGNNQGCPLSMIFYAFYNAGLLEISPYDCRDEKQFGFVDDVTLLAIGENFNDTYQKITNMMTRPNGGFDWSTTHHSQFELSKLALMNFSPKSSHNNELTIQHPLSQEPTVVKPVQSYKFLGVLFDPKLRWKAQSDRAARSAEAWINLVIRLARTASGISTKGMRQLYTAIAIPKMTYAADVWYTIPHYPHANSKKRTGSVKFTKRVTSAQRRMATTMLGAMRTTAGDVLNAHAAVPPPHLIFLKALIRSATRLVTLPDSHPLFSPVRRAIKRQVKRHRSPLHHLFLITGVEPTNYETILTARRRRNYEVKADIYIEPDRLTAVEQAADTSGTIIYTDGSGFEHGIGAAAVMTKNGTVVDSLRYYLGSDTIHTVYEAEAVAVILALHLANKLKRKRSLTIGMDNQAVLMGLNNQRSKPSHYLLDKIHDSLEDLQVSQARLRNKVINGYRKGKGRTRLEDDSLGWIEWKLKTYCDVEFVWTPGHEGIEGNENADKEAKRAAQGESSPLPNLPPFLRKKPLPTSISATRQVMKKRVKAAWKDEWSNSPRYARMNKIDYSLPSNDYLEIIDQLRRNQASLLTQFRTGHIPLNEILHRIKKVESPNCPHCGAGVRESIFHYLLICPRYLIARRHLQAMLDRATLSIPFLLGAREGIPHLLRFVSDTKRFKTIFGEVRLADDFVFKSKHKPK
jgi:ribonuclease HI